MYEDEDMGMLLALLIPIFWFEDIDVELCRESPMGRNSDEDL